MTVPPPASLSRSRWAVLVVFAANGLVMASWVSRVPSFRDEFGLSDQRLGLVLLSVSAGAVLALPATGAVVGRFGARATVRAGCLVCVLGLTLMGLASSVSMLVAGMLLTGLGAGSWDVAMNVEGAAVERGWGRSVMPHFHAAFSLGTVAGALVGALLNAVHVATSWHLVGIAVLAVAATQLYCTRFRAAVRPAAATSGPASAPHAMHALHAWLEPRVLAIGLLVFCFAFTEGSANDWLALGLVDGYGVPNARGVAGFAVFVAAMTLGRFTGPRLLDRNGRAPVLRFTALVAAAGLALVVFGTLVPVAFVGAALWGLGASLGFPVGMSAGADDPAHAAARVSVVSSIGYTAFLAGPPFVGFLAQRVGVLHALLSVLVLLALGALVSGATNRRGCRAAL